ncbi:hypothetical protein C0J52_18005 [Blattella germanica]|nr:hypothetical protein C0J52_18005 [Blattella germanica]
MKTTLVLTVTVAAIFLFLLTDAQRETKNEDKGKAVANYKQILEILLRVLQRVAKEHHPDVPEEIKAAEENVHHTLQTL